MRRMEIGRGAGEDPTPQLVYQPDDEEIIRMMWGGGGHTTL
jgi:hypothetical protein